MVLVRVCVHCSVIQSIHFIKILIKTDLSVVKIYRGIFALDKSVVFFEVVK